jgi:hypothetical protein
MSLSSSEGRDDLGRAVWTDVGDSAPSTRERLENLSGLFGHGPPPEQVACADIRLGSRILVGTHDPVSIQIPVFDTVRSHAPLSSQRYLVAAI